MYKIEILSVTGSWREINPVYQLPDNATLHFAKDRLSRLQNEYGEYSKLRLVNIVDFGDSNAN